MYRPPLVTLVVALAAALALATASTRTAIAQGFNLGTRLEFPAGANPLWIATGDLNGDGYADLVTANNNSNTVSVLLGNGTGSFAPKTDFATGTHPYAVAIGDLNGDGRPDVVTANQGANTVSVLLGNGAGGLGSKTDFATGTAPYFVAIGDLNGDGKPDLAVVNYLSNTVSVLLNDGANGFTAKTDYPTGSFPSSVVINDVNGDGLPDLVVADYGANTVSVLLANGTGGFGAKTDFSTGTGPFALAVSDLNNDGKPDLVTTNFGANTVSVLIGAGTGSFAAKVDYPTAASGSPTSVVITDVNGDGKSDLVASSFTTSQISVLLGDGLGGFSGHSDISTVGGALIHAIVALDANGDGQTDLATVNSSASFNSVYVLLANNSGGFAAKSDFTAGTNPRGVAIGDVNGDGHPDLAVTNYGSNTVSILLGDGAGGFGPRSDFATGATPATVAMGDFNRDGRLDLAIANYGTNTVSVLLGNGGGGFGAKTDFAAGTNPFAVVIADLNGDGKLDIATANYSSNSTSVLLGDGAGSFAPKTDYPVGNNPQALAVADVNGDGLLDLVVANGFASSISVLLNNGVGGFGAKTDFATGSSPFSVAVRDMNGDGKPDVMTGNWGANSVSLLLGSGTGTFGAHNDYTVGTTPYAIAISDLNGDGKLDVVTANSGNATTSVLLGTGTGSFGPLLNLTSAGNPSGVAIGDLNGDGRPDLAVGNYGSASVSVFLSLEKTRASLSAAPNPGVLGGAATLTASVQAVPPGSGVPTGTVSFFDGTTLLGTSPVTGGMAGLSLFEPYLGRRSLSAVYNGDGKYFPSFSPVVSDRVASTAAANITAVKDVRPDHGREVEIDFQPSGFDFPGVGATITGYEVYRKDGLILSSPAGVPGDRASEVHPGRPSPSGVQLLGWDYLLSAPAHGESGYQVVAPTPADSSVLGINYESFLIRAITANPNVYYDSSPTSGYSVDNLSVSVPSPFTAAYSAGATHLHWGANSESDFWYYNLYRGSSASFVPSAANRIASQADTGYVDVGPAGSYYKISAANLSGIESGYATATTGSTTGVDQMLPTVVSLAPPSPNPAHGAVALRFGLPRESQASLQIFDISGRLVRVLANGSLAAGVHAMSWDLRGGSGNAVPGGIYFARLIAEGRAYTQRFAVEK